MVTIIVKIVTKLDLKSIPTRVNVVIPKNILLYIGSYSDGDFALPARVSGLA